MNPVASGTLKFRKWTVLCLGSLRTLIQYIPTDKKEFIWNCLIRQKKATFCRAALCRDFKTTHRQPASWHIWTGTSPGRSCLTELCICHFGLLANRLSLSADWQLTSINSLDVLGFPSKLLTRSGQRTQAVLGSLSPSGYRHRTKGSTVLVRW